MLFASTSKKMSEAAKFSRSIRLSRFRWVICAYCFVLNLVTQGLLSSFAVIIEVV